ncbi:Helix-turn-helix domain-containing protein [Alkalibacterium gilvum]|uniref:Helix-turn-helix domain-containing protein n=1 Tax=Alkalibacterium gilvum TaxID=1130080 RepID=A0A1H6RZR2_9LACT|nr:helix-turn-helix domain-containing protein [Alkalibacterium gilvum]SEI59074.1 Helix-turn-helix domain-containing protein [Alkalibacterium gilvum]
MAKLHLDITSELEEELQELFIKSAKHVLAELSKQELHSKEFMNLQESAEFVGVSHNTLMSWIRDYDLSYIHIGGKKMIEKKELIEFLRSFKK